MQRVVKKFKITEMRIKKPSAKKTKLDVAHYRPGSEEIYFGLGKCFLGDVLVAESQKGICRVAIGKDANKLVVDLQMRFPTENLIEGDAKFQKLVTKVVKFVNSPTLKCDLPLDLRGTEFQQKVWMAVKKIPAGATASYAEIAQRIGAPKAMRAVGTSCSVNPIAVLLPCHRVVRSDHSNKKGDGCSLKDRLLEMEGAKG
jgi:AraC family transcriptional regulator of adaptative response/methylated-DNA-[protein]-cysteine methyltransferase